MKILAFAQFGSMVGGANRSFFMVLANLKRLGHDLFVVTPNHGEFNEALDHEGISNLVYPYHEISGVKDYTAINFLRWLRFHWYSYKDKCSAAILADRLKNEQFDVVYINDTDVYFGAYVAIGMKIPFVWHFRSYVDPTAHYLMDAVSLFDKCSQFISISHGMEHTLFDNPLIPNDRISVIHNGIPLNDSLILASQTRHNGFHMVQCGRITADKGHKDAIKAVAILKERHIDDIYLHIVGSVPGNVYSEYLRELQEIIKLNELEDNIIFEGICNDMAAFRRNMNVELMCSECEPFGRVTLEGMRSGLIVIGSNTGGTPEIITDEQTGLLYKQGDQYDLADKIAKVYNDENYAQELIANAIIFSRANFTPEKNVKSIEQVLVNAALK